MHKTKAGEMVAAKATDGGGEGGGGREMGLTKESRLRAATSTHTQNSPSRAFDTGPLFGCLSVHKPLHRISISEANRSSHHLLPLLRSPGQGARTLK